MKRILIPALIALGLTAAACSGGEGETATESTQVQLKGFVGIDGAQHLVDELDAHGIPTTTPQPGDAALLRLVRGLAFNVDINRDGFDDGINQFPDSESLAEWVRISKSVSGIAVTGDTWAISLNSFEGRSASEQLAPKVAAALGGTVQS
jgi:hypothetical protein